MSIKVGCVGVPSRSLMDKLLEIKTPLTNHYNMESKPVELTSDKIKRQTQFINDRYGFAHGSKKKRKKKRK